MTGAPAAKRPNILLIMCDQYRFPRFSGPEGGFPPELDNILGFQGEVTTRTSSPSSSPA